MKRYIAYAVAVCFFLVQAAGAEVLPTGGGPIRLAGPNRYATAAAISAFDPTYSGYIVLARGDHYADALAGVPLAALAQAPILLTPVNSLAPETRAEILALSPHTVFILGGTAAVGSAVEDELRAMGLTVERIEGPNRFATAAAIAARVAPAGASTAVVAGGRDFPDALTAAAYAGARGYPILLTEKDSLPRETAEALAALGVEETILAGGSAVVAERVAGLLPGCTRISGADRYETAVALARYFQPDTERLFIAGGRGFADAITGAALAARWHSGLLLTDRTVPPAVEDYLRGQEVGYLYLLGGTSAISLAQEEHLRDLVSLVGKYIVFTSPATMTALPAGGEELRYPYAGFITQVLGVSGDNIQIRFGSKTGWVPKDGVTVTEKDEDTLRLGWQFTRPVGTCYVNQPPAVSGYNVYAPVMYEVSGGALRRLVNLETEIQLAREQGYQVWLTVQQMGTSPVFSDAVISEILARARALDADGVNIDFEGLGEANRTGLTDFMRRLYPRAKELGLTVSIDINRHANNRYGLSFDRPALVPYCDYMALMAYGQTGSGGPACSVAALPWVESSIQLLLAEVPREKVLLGIPFYLRNWRYEDTKTAEEDLVVMLETMRLRSEPSTTGGSATVVGNAQVGEYFPCLGEVAGENILGETKWYIVAIDGRVAYVSGYPGYTGFLPKGEIYGKAGLSSYALSLQAALDIYENHDPVSGASCFTTQAGKVVEMSRVEIMADAASGQNKVTYLDAEGRYNEIWLEDFASLAQRRLLMEKYGLAGLAAWSLDWLDARQQAWVMLAD